MSKKAVKIVVSGPESSGKTELCGFLAGHYGAGHIPEYARAYVEGLNRPYTFEDVEHIALTQKDELSVSLEKGHDLIILDTYLVITKIWFMEVYGKIPGWIDTELKKSEIDLFLVCFYDIPWVEDPVRENPEPMRKYLFDIYCQEIRELGIPMQVVKGTGSERLQSALDAIHHHLPQLNNE